MRKNTGYVLLAVSAVLTAVGLCLEQNGQVLEKAVNVCLECIGIG